MLISGASGPSNTLKLLLNNACALSSNTFTKPTAAVLPPADALAQITPVVIVFTAPGCKVNGPADCKNLLSAGIFHSDASDQTGIVIGLSREPPTPHPLGSESSGNMKSQTIVPSFPFPPYVKSTLSFHIARK